MSLGWARISLTGYRWLGAAVYPFVGTYLAIRAAKGKEEHTRRNERYGYASAVRPAGPLVWFHAASVGETTAVIPLIEDVRQRGITVVLTTGTVTSAAVVRERLGSDVIHQYVPLDLKPAISRFLDYWHPDLAVIAESEIWPMTILELGARRMPQVLVNGRLSDRSFRNWAKRARLADALFENLSHVAAQSESDAERFRTLGARPVSVTGNLKVDAPAPACDSETLETLRGQIGTRKTWAAISTFDGEEDIAAAVHRSLEDKHDVLTIVVPRHPDRCDAIEESMKTKGLNVVRRSSGAPIASGTNVLLGDTIGEMGLYLRLTEIAFVGRSLAASGGQNPLEPSMLGCAILAGRNVENFREIYRELEDRKAVVFVDDEAGLEQSLDRLLSDAAERKAMTDAAEAAVSSLGGALARTIVALEPYINPLTVQARLATTAGGA